MTINFDPISQKEYYQMTAFFNNVNELGMIGNDKNFGPLLPLLDTQTEAKLIELSNQIKTLEDSKKLTSNEIASIEDYLKTIQSEKIIPPKPDGLYPFNSIRKIKNAKGRTEIRLDNNKHSTASGEPKIIDGKVGKAIRLDNDYDQIFMKGLGNFNLYESFSGGGWLHIEPKEGFKTIMGNIGDKNTGWRGWIFFLDSLNRLGVKIVHSNSHNYIHVLAEESINEEDWTHLFFTYDGSAKASGIQLFVNGKPIKQNILFDQLYKNILPVKGRGYVPDLNRAIRIGRAHNYLFTDTDDGILKGSVDQFRIYEKYLTELEIAAFFEDEAKESNLATIPDSIYLNHFLHRHSESFQNINQKLTKLRKEKYELMDQVREVMVIEEMTTPRKTHILQRGQYDALGEEVGPETPSNILPFPENLQKNRLGLAEWLVSGNHQLTARVTVNRYWQMIFGRGLVETPHDFGSQGALPSHPELLDWLAVEFQESDWDLKALLKLMVMSSTYRQSSIATEEHLLKDRQNVYLARGASYRLPGEMIRDNALAVSGLLNPEIGGASVKPYQPPGLWKEKNEFSGFLLHYRPDSGQSLYRRTLYTFIRRTSPPPAMVAFDMSGRDVCMVKRENTNTPLQALVTLNDPQFVEAARVLAEKVQKEGAQGYQAQIDYSFELICGRKPNAKETELIQKQYQFALKRYRENPQAAAELLTVGEHPFDQSLDKVETAALAMVANTILNFDEAYMKR